MNSVMKRTESYAKEAPARDTDLNKEISDDKDANEVYGSYADYGTYSKPAAQNFHGQLNSASEPTRNSDSK